MKKQQFLASDRYSVYDNVLGKKIDMQVFLQKVDSNGWEKVYAEQLAIFIDSGNCATTDILAHIIRHKNRDNLIYGTYKSLAAEIKVSVSSITKIFKILKERNMIKNIGHGVYFINPHIIRNGQNNAGIVLISEWEKL